MHTRSGQRINMDVVFQNVVIHGVEREEGMIYFPEV